MLLAQLVVEYVADTSKLVSSVQKVKQSAEEGASSLRNMATAGAAVATAALIGVGVASVKMAGDFQSAVTTLETGAGESAKNLQMVSDGMLNLATQTGTATKQLTDGMFMIESAGFRGADALNILKNAAEGAKVGNADLGTTAQAVTGILLNYKDSHLTAANAVNTLIATVSSGQVHMQDLAHAMANVEPIAAKAGISLTDISAAMATMTAKTIPADQAATYLRQTIMAIENPTKKASDAFKAMGLDSADVAAEMKVSLPGALEMITDAAGKKFPVGSAQYIAAISNMVGGTKSMQGIMNLTGSDMATFKANVDNISNAVKNGGNSIIGWDKVQGDFNQKMDQARATIEVLGIKIGTALLPALGRLVDGFSSPAFQSFATTVAGVLTSALLGLINGISQVAAWISQLVSFFQRNQAAAIALQVGLAILAGVILGALIVAFAMAVPAAAAAAIAFLAVAWPIIAIVGIGAGLVALLVLLYQRFAPVREVVDSVGKTFQMMWGVIVSALMPAWQELQGALSQAMPMFQFIGAVILGVVVTAIGILIGVVEGLAVGIGFAISGIINIITGFVQMWTGGFQIVEGIVLFFVDLVTGNFSKLGSDLGLIWSGIVNVVVGAFNMIKGVFVTVFGFLIGFVGGFVVGVIQFFQHLYDAIVGHSIIPDMVNGVVNWLEQLPGRAGAAIQSMASTVMNTLNGLASSALQAGANIVNSIADGIRNAIGAVGSAISTVTQFISDHLPHSPAKIGPLMGLQDQGMEISNQVAKGMVNGVPLINSAIGNLTKPIALGVKGAASTGSNTPLQGGEVHVHNHIYMDGKEITNQVMNRAVKDLRGHGLKK